MENATKLVTRTFNGPVVYPLDFLKLKSSGPSTMDLAEVLSYVVDLKQ